MEPASDVSNNTAAAALDAVPVEPDASAHGLMSITTSTSSSFSSSATAAAVVVTPPCGQSSAAIDAVGSKSAWRHGVGGGEMHGDSSDSEAAHGGGGDDDDDDDDDEYYNNDDDDDDENDDDGTPPLRADSGASDRDVDGALERLRQRRRRQPRLRRSLAQAGYTGLFRVSPIQEEDGASVVSTTRVSPTGAARPLDPPSTDSTDSTYSTDSVDSIGSMASARTVRAGLPSKSSNSASAVRTPSYPFPYVPGTPRGHVGNHPQPYTAVISPTAPAAARPLFGRSRSSMASTTTISDVTTPTANRAFLPPGATDDGFEDPRFPTPNLYDAVLQLNAEPGMEAWWTTTANLIHDHFKADRATLVMPMDPTEIENVPWGQKTTFCMYGSQEYIPAQTSPESGNRRGGETEIAGTTADSNSPARTLDHVKPQKLHRERLRPRLESRHSYAGHSRQAKDALDLPTPNAAVRPSGPQRTATHTAGMMDRYDNGTASLLVVDDDDDDDGDDDDDDFFPTRKAFRQKPSRLEQQPTTTTTTTTTDLAAAAKDNQPFAEVFTTLRKLDHEVRPLIGSGGVKTVMERGRVVIVTRDYKAENSAEESGVASDSAGAPSKNQRSSGLQDDHTAETFSSYFQAGFAFDKSSQQALDYEEYEQHPASPWAQSPAPSPAIQADEEVNPFFKSAEQDLEDSFTPAAATPRNYAELGQVAAIGVDGVNTVIHVPLLHPLLSRPMPSLMHTSNDEDANTRAKSTSDTERRAPIAILSLLSSIVPYPHNLVQSLKLLGPHLATSLAIAQQFSATNAYPVTIRHRRTESGQVVTTAPLTIAPTTLEEMVNAGIETPMVDAMSGSITSPSDYSSHSKQSPSSSIVGTPGWDPATHGWASAARSGASTPAVSGTEMVDNYFEARKRGGHRSGSGNSQTPVRSAAAKKGVGFDSKATAPPRKPSPSEEGEKRGGVRLERGAKYNNNNNNNNHHHNNNKSQTANVEEHGSRRPISSGTQNLQPTTTTTTTTTTQQASDRERRHSLLHSFGADVNLSFGFPSVSALEPRSPGAFGHARKASYSDDMPPPSERLLRTIIDSVPVQIFTAEPDTGKMTWVNSKFLVYRGMEPRQVISDPWSAIHPADRQEFMTSWLRALRTTQQLQQKVRLERFDGSYRWFYVRAAPLKDKRQVIVHWIGTMMDFNEQHIAEMNVARQQETAASEAKYRALANSSPQIVFAANRIRGVTFCNSQWVHYSGQTEVQALGLGFMDHVHPDDLLKCKLPTLDDQSKMPTNVPTSLPPDLHRSASTSATSTSSRSSETEKGSLIAGGGGGGGGGGNSGSNGSSSSSSSSTETTSPVTHMPQRQLSELVSKGILKVARDADGRPSYSTEVRLKSKDGNYRWHLVRILLAEPFLQTENDGVETWYGTCTDINDHKALERDLKQTMDEKSRFLSNMSHEIRTPLNGITGMVNFLMDSNLTVEQMEHVNIIRSSTEGLRGLINDILDLSKAEAGMIQLKMDWLHIRALIEEVNDLTSAMAIDKGLELNYIVERDLPAQVKGDRFRLRQILLNVVGNAIKFTNIGEVFIHCSTKPSERKLDPNELEVKFEVIDTGRGFNEREAEFLFKRFSQIDGNNARQNGGTGLGLVISKQLAQLHGGDMSAQGVSGKGATFTFFVKVKLPSGADQPFQPPQPASSISIPILPPPTATPSATPSASTVKAQKNTLFPQSAHGGGGGGGGEAKASPKFALEHSQSPVPYVASPETTTGVQSPSISVSSAGSEPSSRSVARTSSLRSERSSASSIAPEAMVNSPPLNLVLPTDAKLRRLRPDDTPLKPLTAALGGGGQLPTAVARMYSILVVCPLRYSRKATVEHIDKTLPKSVPHQITARESLEDCREMFDGDTPVLFTHVVIVLHDVPETVSFVDHILSLPAYQSTSIVLITDVTQRRSIIEQGEKFDYTKLAEDRRLHFVFKPLKPSRFASIFDPKKEREMSTDRNQDSAQKVASTHKQVFEELSRRLGNRGKRVLLVEDDRMNQVVVLKFLSKCSIEAENVQDGVECMEKVFSHQPGYYSIILCDLQMPNKDGYQTCKEIRRWERRNKHPHIPIIAMSANVLGNVYQLCVDAGFNSYLTKPVEFTEFKQVLITFMDPNDPTKPHEFMKKRKTSETAA